MTLEIPDSEQFSKKLAYFLVAMQKLERAGIDTDPDYLESMVDDFLTQFTATTMMPAPRVTAGWVVTLAGSDAVPFDFRGNIYSSKSDAQLAVTKFLNSKDYGRTSDYDIKEVYYFG